MRLRQQFLLWFVLLVWAVVFYWVHRSWGFSELRVWSGVFFNWARVHLVLTAFGYGLVYVVFAALSLPGAVLLTLLGGALFGKYWGSALTTCSASVGACCCFVLVRYFSQRWFVYQDHPLSRKIQAHLGPDVFFYLLFLRLVPLFPFNLINMISGLLSVPLSTFLVSTCLGIMPGVYLYSQLGQGLGEAAWQSLTVWHDLLWQPSVFWPLVALGCFSLVPVLFRWVGRPRAAAQGKDGGA